MKMLKHTPSMIRLSVCAFLTVVLSGLYAPSSAQRRYEELALRNAQPEAYREALILPDHRVHVVFRIPHARLIFLRLRQPDQQLVFEASLDVTAAIYQHEQRIAEHTWTGTKKVSTFEATQDKTQDVTGSIPLRLDPGAYTLRLTVQDNHAQTSWSFPPTHLEISADTSLAPPFFVKPPSSTAYPLVLQPINLSGRVPFGQPAYAALWFTDPVERIIYRVEQLPARLPSRPAPRSFRRRKQQPPSPEHLYTNVPGTLVFQDTLTAASLIPFDTIQVSDTAVDVIIPPPASPSHTLALLNLRSETLDDGYYRLSIAVHEKTGRVRTIHHIFATHWRNMSLSLRDIDLAIENLRFLVDKKTLKALKKGSREEKEARLRAFWKQRDPTPDTPFNELMAEYYRRIDYAAWTFRTGNAPVPNGLDTDRARIYIRYGAPASMERTLKEKGSGVREIWRYPDGRTFIFEASTSLDPFVLVAIRENP